MNRFQIRDILNEHKEHFRVLPTGAMLDLHRIIDTISQEERLSTVKVERKSEAKAAEPAPKVVKETKRDVGKRTKKVAKKSKRS